MSPASDAVRRSDRCGLHTTVLLSAIGERTSMLRLSTAVALAANPDPIRLAV